MNDLRILTESISKFDPSPSKCPTDAEETILPARFWLLVILTGVGAVGGGGVLMLSLRAVEHLPWVSARHLPGRRAIEHGAAANANSAWRRYPCRFRAPSAPSYERPAGKFPKSIGFRSGTFPAPQTLARPVLSIVLVGLGSSIGCEGVAKQAGAVSASKLSDWCRLPSSQRRLLAACGAPFAHNSIRMQ